MDSARSRKISSVGWIILCLPLLIGTAHAGTNGILEGTVKEKRTGEPLAGVTVALLNAQRGAATDAQGRFEIQNLRAGTYDLRCTSVGYTPYLLKSVVITPDLRTRIVIELEPASVEMGEVVVVQERPHIQKDVTGTIFLVPGEDVRLLPLDRATDVVSLKPGVTLEGNIRGGKSTEVSYLVDGLPVQDLMSGGVVSQLPATSIGGISIYTGGFEPEYGNALSGVVNIVTSTGTNAHAFTLRADKDNLFGGTQVSKTTRFEASAAGPILRDRLFYAAAGNGILTGTRWWQDFRHFFAMPVDRSVNGFGKLDYHLTPTLRFGAHVLYSHHDWRDYEFDWRFDLSGLPPERRDSYRVAALVSHSISDNLFYTASLSRYFVKSTIGDNASIRAAIDDPYQYDFFLRYIEEGYRALRARSTQETYTAKFDATVNLHKVHLMKFGGELNMYHLSSNITRLEPRKTFFGKPIIGAPQLDFSSAYAYTPRTGGLYIQDKIDLPDDGLLLTFGARYDFLDPRASRPAIEATLLADTAVLMQKSGSIPAAVKHQFSPRLGFAMQVAEKGYLFVNLGWYFQYPLFDYLYTGLDRVALTKGVSALTGNPDLEPERSKTWEISLKYILVSDIVGSITYFRKETSNQVDTKTFVPGDSKLAGTFGFAEYVNNPYADASGFEVLLTRDRGAWITGELSYTYMVAEGLSSNSLDGFYIAQYGLPPATRVYPLSWDQRHTVKAVTNFAMPWAMKINTVFQWHSGRPYTAYPTATGFEPIDGGRFYQNNERMPAYASLDFRVEQHFRPRWWPTADISLFMEMRNVSNQQNVRWVDSNGQVGGELHDPSGYYTGRRTSVGIQTSF